MKWIQMTVNTVKASFTTQMKKETDKLSRQILMKVGKTSN